MKNIVITGGSRGIGYGLAREFLKKGHQVVITGRYSETLISAVDSLEKESSNSNISYIVCDVCKEEDVSNLWERASAGKAIDIWINNAGLGQGTKLLHEITANKIEEILDTNIKGLINCSRIAFKNMLEQGFGAIYNMEGFGSDGRKMKRMTIYGTSKYAVSYFTQSLALEAKGTPIIIGALSPGMVVTELLTNPISENTAINKEANRIFHILADQVEPVTSYLTNEILKNKKNGVRINWLTSKKILLRFMKNMIKKRKVEGIPDF